MTEEYWQRYKREVHDTDVWNSNELFRDTKKVLERKKSDKHPLELFNMCKSDNAYIRQIKNSPNLTLGTPDLRYCLSLFQLLLIFKDIIIISKNLVSKCVKY